VAEELGLKNMLAVAEALGSEQLEQMAMDMLLARLRMGPGERPSRAFIAIALSI